MPASSCKRSVTVNAIEGLMTECGPYRPTFTALKLYSVNMITEAGTKLRILTIWRNL